MPNNDEEWGEPLTSTVHNLDEQGPIAGVYLGYEEITNDLGVSRLHGFDVEGRKVKSWGRTHMNRLLEGREGELVKVLITGEEINLGGGRKMKEYQLFSKGRVSPPPALPDRPLSAPESDAQQSEATREPRPFEGPHGATEANLLRARRLAIAMKDASIDDTTRGQLIDFWTFGETSSSKDLNDRQAESLYKLVQRIRRGEIDLRFMEDGTLYLEDSKGKLVTP